MAPWPTPRPTDARICPEGLPQRPSSLSLGCRRKVGTRVAIGFASVLALLAIVAGIAYYGLTAGEDYIRRFDRVSDAAVAKLQNNFEQMRRSVILYGQNGASQLVADAHKFQAEAEKQAAEAKSKIPAGDRQQMLAQADGTLGQYAKNFDLVVKAMNDKEKNDSMMRPLGGRLQGALEQLSGGPVGKMQAALAVAVDQEADWKEF